MLISVLDNIGKVDALYLESRIQESTNTRFLVLELAEGETLAPRIARGPIPADESIELAMQIAEALEGAHDEGIVHRDLKPANIKIRPEGKVKVLDFGSRKCMSPSLRIVRSCIHPR